MPRTFAAYQRRLREMEVREDDVWIFSFPKSGKQFGFNKLFKRKV